ncbi:UNVERIFIED_CONTAM: hypothetical protein FKN15_022868, partial [Acipenser sinensis]
VSQVTDQLTYFIRKEGQRITAQGFEREVQFGTVRAGHTESLLRLMNGIYAPQIFDNNTWADSIRNNFSAHLHRFLASLTDTRYKLQGHTVLYIPGEALKLKPVIAAKDKELVQRLETAMIHWTRQIKEVLSAQEAVETGDNSGPLEEIEFWRSRCADLTGISEQLDKPGVKHIRTILELSKSSYVTPFCKLSKQIQDGSLQAQSNLSFLSILGSPCEELAKLKPRDIPDKLPHLLSLIRVIWLSNEIIRLCCKEISLERIFEGYIVSSKQSLNECVRCCMAWKQHYLHVSQLHHKCSSTGWVLDQTSIFAQVDAFMQRCKDLLEVCQCQQHFARREEGNQTPLPCFTGHKGPEIARSLLEIEGTFEKNLLILKAAKKTILDVKNTSWHDDYNRFRSNMKDLEVMMQNLITTAFETVTTVEQGVKLLDVFQHLSAREAIKHTIDKKTVDVYALYNDELSRVSRELSRKICILPAHMPQYAGQAHWARALRRRIERPMEILSKAHYVPQIGLGVETRAVYKQLLQTLDELVRKIFTDWTQGLDRQCERRLDTPLLIRSAEKPGMLDVNFDKNLLKMFNEIHYWERLLFEIPHYMAEVYHRKEDLRNLRENVLLVVRDYNRIIEVLSSEERGLFRERIRILDKKIQPGLSKLLWSSKGASNYFIQECRLHASKVQLMVDEYKSANLLVSRSARQISELLLVRVDGKRVYKDLEFEQDQQGQRDSVLSKLQSVHQDIVNTMARTYEIFKNDGQEVQQHWLNYTDQMDRMVEEAFRLNIKWSLQELAKAINGDSKTIPNPLFRVMVVLLSDLPGSNTQLISTISIFKRLPDLLTKSKSQREPIHVIIERDDDIKKIQAQISAGMAANAVHLQSYQKTWDTYREIWEINKDSFIRRYQRLNPPVSSFDADIARSGLPNFFQNCY